MVRRKPSLVRLCVMVRVLFSDLFGDCIHLKETKKLPLWLDLEPRVNGRIIVC